MAYLMDSRSPSNLGAYRRVSPMPVLPQRRVDIPHRRRFALGQYTYTLSYPPSPSPPDIGVSPAMSEQISAAVASITPTAPPPPTGYPPLPAQINANYTSQPMSLDPLNFASPQAAIAAGVDPQKAYAAWSKAIGSFPSQQAAVAAGIPAGVVTSLWPASRRTVSPPSSSLIDQLGGWPKVFFYGAVGLVLIELGGGKRRR